MTERLYLTVSGNVQIVGYRKEVKRCAIQFNILGHVMNQKDGTAKIVCEGDKENLDQFYNAIFIREGEIYVDNIKKRSGKVTGEFHQFWVQDDFVTLGERQIMERLDKGLDLTLGIRQDLSRGRVETVDAIKTMDSHIETMDTHIVNLDKRQSETIEAVKTMDSHVQDLDKTQSETTIAIKAMDVNMSSRFDSLDNKYGEFGGTMKGMASDMKDMKGSMSGISSDLHEIKLTAFPPTKRIKKQVLKQARSRS